MKNLLAVLVATIITILSITTFSAENVLDIDLSCDETLKNRLFEVSVIEKSETDICAGEMVLSFDENIVEFKEVKSEAFDIEIKENDDSVHIVFAKAYPTESGSELFKVVLKSIDYGSFDLSATCSECVDINLIKLNADATSVNIEVNKNSVSLKTKDSSENKSMKSSLSKKSSSVENVASSTSDFIGIDNDNEIYIIILVALGFCVIIVITFYFGTLFSKKTTSADLVEDDDDDEEDDDDNFYY